MQLSALMALLAGGVVMATDASAASALATGGICKVVCAPAPRPHVKKAARPRHAARHRVRHHARRHDYYGYREEASAGGEWQRAPNDATIPGPPPYGPPAYGFSGGAYAQAYAQDYRTNGACDCGPGLEIDRSGWSGGVGYGAASEGFVDGYGMMHYGGGSFWNGPSYNSYGQSFPFNPARAAPFQPRVMGGFAGGARFGFGSRR